MHSTSDADFTAREHQRCVVLALLVAAFLSPVVYAALHALAP